jgi:protein SCO1/2
VTGRQASPERGDESSAIFDRAFWLVVALAVALGVLVVVRLVADASAPAGGDGQGQSGAGSSGIATTSAAPTPAPSIDVDAYLDFFPRAAPPLALTGPGGEPVSLADYAGEPVLVFFGYTHCPDVCPTTIGAVGQAIDAVGGGARAIFVSVDPERDTIPWLAEFVQYMPAGFTAVTGTPAEVRATADDWGVRYARVETDDPAAYTMSHTADVFIVDGEGRFRGRFPFGTEPETMTAVLREVVATTAAPSASRGPSLAPSPIPTVVPTTSAAASPEAGSASLWPQVVSSSVWAGDATPVILALFDDLGGRIGDPTLRVTARLLDAGGAPAGDAVEAVRVQPPGLVEASYVPTLAIPTPGRWRIALEAAATDGSVRRGDIELTALDPGGTPAIGAPGPTIRTQTAADVGGDLTWVTTDPLPDPRLSSTSTSDALGAGRPFVLVVDSYSFKVTPACGRAVAMAKRLVDRWPDIPFIHHEPYRYSVVTTEPVLEGTLQSPVLTDVAEAWGVGSEPWGVGSMPWLFIVDGDGIVRAKYQGVMGTADVDVLLTLLTQAT